MHTQPHMGLFSRFKWQKYEELHMNMQSSDANLVFKRTYHAEINGNFCTFHRHISFLIFHCLHTTSLVEYSNSMIYHKLQWYFNNFCLTYPNPSTITFYVHACIPEEGHTCLYLLSDFMCLIRSFVDNINLCSRSRSKITCRLAWLRMSCCDRKVSTRVE